MREGTLWELKTVPMRELDKCIAYPLSRNP